MSEPIPSSNGYPSTETAKITDAIQRAVRKAVWTHARLGQPVAEWRGGRVVWVSPEEILAQFEPGSDR
jgi:hypothetical protein